MKYDSEYFITLINYMSGQMMALFFFPLVTMRCVAAVHPSSDSIHRKHQSIHVLWTHLVLFRYEI